MANFIVTVTFSEEHQVEAETRERAERRAWEHYAAEPGRLLAKARCTIDYQAGAALHWMSHEAKVDFIMRQLYFLCVDGYSREQVSRLVEENFRQL